MKTLQKTRNSIMIGFCLITMISCQSRSADFEALSNYVKSELQYTKSIKNQTILIISLNTCHVCLDKIADNLRKTNKKVSLLLIFSADAQKDIVNYLESNLLYNKFEFIADLKSGLFNQPFYDGSAGYYFKVGDNKIEEMIRFDINHNFESFEKEILNTE